MQTIDEPVLIEQVQKQHDVRAFRELYRAYFARIYGYVAYRVSRPQDREDVVADVFLKALESLHRFSYRGEGSFAAWLFRIAHNQIATFYRQTRHETLELEEVGELESENAPPERFLLQKETHARLHEFLRQLPPRRQEIITLRFFGGLRNQEIAAILNLDERTVASHLSRGLQDLQALFQKELVEDTQ